MTTTIFLALHRRQIFVQEIRETVDRLAAAIIKAYPTHGHAGSPLPRAVVPNLRKFRSAWIEDPLENALAGGLTRTDAPCPSTLDYPQNHPPSEFQASFGVGGNPRVRCSSYWAHVDGPVSTVPQPQHRDLQLPALPQGNWAERDQAVHEYVFEYQENTSGLDGVHVTEARSGCRVADEILGDYHQR